MSKSKGLTFNEASIDVMDCCARELTVWRLDAINGPMLLQEIIYEEQTGLYSYLAEKLKDDDFDVDDTLALIQSEWLISLRNNGSEEVSGKTEKESKTEEETKTDQYRSEYDSDISIADEQGGIHLYPVSAEVVSIMKSLKEMCKVYKIKVVEPAHILAAMFSVEDESLKELFSNYPINFKTAKKLFTEMVKKGNQIIPQKLSSFLENWNDKVNPLKPSEVLGRDKEVRSIWNIFLKMNKRNPIITGDAGVGKSALIEKITHDIVTKACPKEFWDYFVISLDVNSLIAGTIYRGQAEERIKDLIEFLKTTNNIILFIDEAHTMLGAGSCREGEMDLSNALKPILARGETIVICATTNDEYEKYFAQDAALSRRFERVDVKEPNSNEVGPMIHNKVKALSKFHNVSISQRMVDYIIMISNCFAFDKKNPDKTLDLIDRSMVTAKRKGKKKVDEESIMENFDAYFELFEGMTLDSKKEVAYHEAGHYIAFKALADIIVEVRLLAVSIIPAENYLGVTVYENRRDIMPFTNKEYYIDHIAVDLAGRAAEKFFRQEFTSGAGQDLKAATALAYRVITQFGFNSREEEGNNVFLNTPDYPMLSEKSVNKVNEAVQEMISTAYKKAEGIIEKNKPFLKAMVNLLLKKGIVSEKELDKLWKKYHPEQ